MMQTLAAMSMGNIWMGFAIVGFLVVCVVLMLAVLIQKPQGGGLAGAFGSGAGSGQTAFGAKTGDALTWFTITMFVIWLATAVGLNLAFQPSEPEDPTAIAAPIDGTGAPETGTPATEGGDSTSPIAPLPMMPPEGEEQPAPAGEPEVPPAPAPDSPAADPVLPPPPAEPEPTEPGPTEPQPSEPTEPAPGR